MEGDFSTKHELEFNETYKLLQKLELYVVTNHRKLSPELLVRLRAVINTARQEYGETNNFLEKTVLSLRELTSQITEK